MNRKRSSTASENQNFLNSNYNILTLLSLWVPIVITFVFYPWYTDSILAFLDVWIFFIFALWLTFQFFFRTKDIVIFIKIYSHNYIILIFCFLFIYCIPVPSVILKILSPEIWKDKQWIIQHAPWLFDKSQVFGYFSYNYKQSLLLAIHGIACCMLFLLLVHTIKTKKTLSFIIYSFIVSLMVGTINACLFFYNWSENKIIASVHHHMAIILHITIPMSLAFITTQYRKSKKPLFKTLFYSLKITFKNLISGQHSNLMKSGLVLILIFSFVFQSNVFGLRFISLSISILFGALLLSNNKKMLSLIIVWGIVGISIAVYALMSAEPKSLSTNMDNLMISIVKESPITGIGLGALPNVMSRYSKTDYNYQIFYENNNRAWLYLLTEIGFLGIGICLVTYLIFIFRMYKMWLKRHNAYSRGWALGIMVSLSGIGLFGLGYNYGNPYIVLPIISILAACGFLVLHVGHHSSRHQFFYRTKSIKRNNKQKLLVFMFIIIFIFTGITKFHLFKKTQQPYLKNSCFNEEELIMNLKKNLFHADSWFNMAKFYRKCDKDPINHVQVYLPRADICYETACYFAPFNNKISFETAKYWIWRSLTITSSTKSNEFNNKDIIPKTQEECILHFQKKFKKILEQEPKKLKIIVDVIWEWYKSDIIVLGSLPQKSKTLKKAALEYVLLHKK